ncbi:transmembrane protein 42 [Parasteatoda tepidariorum]|uniref:transmembrane protein 42 n=1 Tax=Parasteatoda tepidariorum TaxID=114398 RepID=UPI00077FCB6F|nr:uncharacterized protein LOC107440534 [Parasteatoda tepidariorum]
MKGITFSLLSGLLAATASLCGKLSMAAEQTLSLCEQFMQHFYPISSHKELDYTYSPFCQNTLFWTRVGFFIAMMLSNLLMWTLFSKALVVCSTTLEATVTNTAANFFFTAVFGQVFFRESLSFLWWMGTMLIILGLVIMHKHEAESTKSNSLDKKQQ